MFGTNSSDTDRGQAYTLEGLIGAMIVLMAVLFALQSAVIMSSTGGEGDQSVQEQVQQEVQDSLIVANQEGNLSELVRNWNAEGEFENASQPINGTNTYTVSEFENESKLGRILNQRFQDPKYNVELHPVNSSKRHLVYQASPPPSASIASYTVTLYDNQTVTSASVSKELHATDSDTRIIPREYQDETSLYNVVEVRVIVWR
ncbi:DUF7288 family protein [Natrinema ejinorense]|uniref:Uncharacterized protein n=1 Tax=Natrinema ejinorense TaxID=373386 RepID=A0A2A5QVN4_9EURY|nr:hypothetical protein [Natrinema ejinorense]PCR90890.1 hypothetical protein CP557_10385 [Natrinema ejinorense]